MKLSKNRDTAKLEQLLSEVELYSDTARLEELLSELGGKPEWHCDTARLYELLSELGREPEWHYGLGGSQFSPGARNGIELPQQSPSTVEVPEATAKMAPPTNRGLLARCFRARIFLKQRGK